MPEPEPCEAKPENIPIDIVYEDEDIIVVNKPKGMVVHPAAGNYTGTLVSALLYHCGERLSGIGGVLRPGIVHRIDKDTSGLLVVAKNDTAHLSLSEQIKEHKVSRIYHAIALGKIDEDITIDLPIGRHPIDRKKMAVTEKNSKNAMTHVKVLERFPAVTYVRCELETGRTHQIRVHLSHKNHPLLGDLVYGAERHPQNVKFAKYTEGQCLHAKELILTHPRTGETMRFTCELPSYFTEILDILHKTM
jgi:23S rRNA pseudouridine1911/1915/1917 synthase